MNYTLIAKDNMGDKVIYREVVFSPDQVEEAIGRMLHSAEWAQEREKELKEPVPFSN
jgi:hypothetical protein